MIAVLVKDDRDTKAEVAPKMTEVIGQRTAALFGVTRIKQEANTHQ